VRGLIKMDWLYRDPLRNVLSFDKFPYERGEGELEIDFMFKSVIYLSLMIGGSVLFLEGGFLIYLLWFSINGLRRKG
jgi:hypothetical protein